MALEDTMAEMRLAELRSQLHTVRSLFANAIERIKIHIQEDAADEAVEELDAMTAVLPKLTI